MVPLEAEGSWAGIGDKGRAPNPHPGSGNSDEN